jgi:hypothetical protein
MEKIYLKKVFSVLTVKILLGQKSKSQNTINSKSGQRYFMLLEGEQGIWEFFVCFFHQNKKAEREREREESSPSLHEIYDKWLLEPTASYWHQKNVSEK